MKKVLESLAISIDGDTLTVFAPSHVAVIQTQTMNIEDGISVRFERRKGFE